MSIFTRPDWKLFRNPSTLCQKAGVPKEKMTRLVAKELFDNALDVCNNAEYKWQGGNKFFIRDYGKGMSREFIENIFSINRPMVTSKLLRLPTRGALGNGNRVVCGAVASSDGKMLVESLGQKYEVIFQIDGYTALEDLGCSDIIEGTKVTIELGDYYKDRYPMLWVENAEYMNHGKNFSCKTSPYFYSSDDFFELCNAFEGNLKELLINFEGMTSKKLKDNISYLSRNSNELDFEETEIVFRELRSISKLISPNKLGCVDTELFGSYNKKSGTFTLKTARGNFDAEIPFVVESWVEELDNEQMSSGLYINKTPITGEYHHFKGKGKCEIWGLGLNVTTKLKNARIMINVMTPYMPITSDGKAPNFAYMNDVIERCVQSASNKARKTLIESKSYGLNKENKIFDEYIESAINKAGGNGEYRFSQRQLYYALRPYIMQFLQKDFDYTYFCKMLTIYENENGQIKNLYRDPRGTLYHPHTKQEISLGTIAVEEYERPEWTFKNIIYCEKEGFFPILKDAGFPERYDCALLSSKGYASRAVKDLFDLLGETEEEIYFFCIHDGDFAGTKIYEALQEETISRPGRKVKIIDLGLNPWEALEMGLEVESFESKRARPIAQYVKDYDFEHDKNYEEWLQNNRVELNSMTTPQFLEWIESKMQEYDNGKVIPDSYTMQDVLFDRTYDIVKENVIQQILKENDFEERLDEEIERINFKRLNVKEFVESDLEEDRQQNWRDSINKIAKIISR